MWGEKWINNEGNIKKDLEILRKQELTLGQCYELYNLLGGDEMKVLENIKIKKEDEKEEEDDNKPKEDIEEAKIVKKPPRRKNI